MIAVLTVAPAEASTPHECSAALFWASSIVTAGSGLVDIVTAPASARSFNQRHVVLVPSDPPRDVEASPLSYWKAPRSRQRARSSESPRPQPVPAYKSPRTAFLLSLLGTAVPVALSASGGDSSGWGFVAGVVMGPSVGHLYAERWGRGLATVGLRGLGAVTWVYSVVTCLD